MTLNLVNPDCLRDPGELPEVAAERTVPPLAGVNLRGELADISEQLRSWERAGCPRVMLPRQIAARLRLAANELDRRWAAERVCDDSR